MKFNEKHGRENAGKATATQQEIQTTIEISLVHWQDTIMQRREEAEMSSGVVTMTQHFGSLSAPPTLFHHNASERLKPADKARPFGSRSSGGTNKGTQFELFSCDRVPWKQTQVESDEKREKFKSTYLPLHRPLHAANVQSRSRTEIVSGQTWRPVAVLYRVHSLQSTFTRLGLFTFLT